MQTFYCPSCDCTWKDDPGLWDGWLSHCPECQESQTPLKYQMAHHLATSELHHDSEDNPLFEPETEAETLSEENIEADIESNAANDNASDSDADGDEGNGDGDGGGSDGP